MSTDLLPETPSPPQPPHPQHRGGRQRSSQGRWRRRGLLLIGGVAVVTSAAALLPGAGSSRQIGPKLTHAITRGDLLVTVTEQGALESSENTEIKCKVRGRSTIIWVIEGGTEVETGDELVRLDTLLIEETISERTKYAHWSRSAAERYRATVARAELAIPEYLEGRYRSQLMTLETGLAINESELRTARNMLAHAEMMADRGGYVSELTVEERTFAVRRAELNLEVQNTRIDALKRFTKEMQLKTLEGALKAAKANLAAAEERALMDATRRDLAVEELKQCVIRAERRGLVIYPSAEPWKRVPEIAEGATVHQDQVLLLMPNLSKMQVKVGIRESIIDRIKPGLAARVTLPGKTLAGRVSSVSPVTAPAGWWTGNVVEYDTIIELPSAPRLRPGMSAEVEVIIARHEDVLTIPVAPLVETAEGDFCWVKTSEGAKRRSLKLGDTNDVFTVVTAGLKEGDEVVLNPLPFMEETQTDARKPLQEIKPDERDSTESGGKRKPRDASSDVPLGHSEREEAESEAAKPRADSQPQGAGDQIIKLDDKDAKPKKP